MHLNLVLLQWTSVRDCCLLLAQATLLLHLSLLQLDKMDASARAQAEMAQKIAEQLMRSSHRNMPAPGAVLALSTDQSALVRAAQQKAAEIAAQVPKQML